MSSTHHWLANVSSENIRWLYDVRERIFRFYLLTVAAIVAIANLTWDGAGSAIAVLPFCTILFLVVSACFAWQIGKQRVLIDKEKMIVRALCDPHSRGEYPALFYPHSVRRVQKSTTLVYIYVILIVGALALAYLLVAPRSSLLSESPSLRSLILLAAVWVASSVCLVIAALVLVRQRYNKKDMDNACPGQATTQAL